MLNYIQYCAIETCREKEIPFHFPFIPPTCSTQIPQMGISAKQFSLIFPLSPDVGEIDFPAIDFPIGGTQFPEKFPQIPLISQ